MSRKMKNDSLKDLLTAGVNQTAGDYLSGPFNLPPKPTSTGSEVGGAATIDTSHEFVMRRRKSSASDQ